MKRMSRVLSGLLVAVLLLSICGTLCGASAEGEKITMKVGNETSQFERKGIEVKIWMIAAGDYGDWTILPSFEGIKIYQSTDGSTRIDKSLTQIRKRIQENGIVETARRLTNEEGEAVFLNVPHGIYFVDLGTAPEGMTNKPSLISVPNKEGEVDFEAPVKVSYEAPPTPTPTPTPTPKPTPTPWETLPPDDITPAPATPTPRPTRTPVPHPYTLTIYYIYWNGNTAAPTHQEIHWPGDNYNVTSPVLPGYTVSIPVVNGTMPGHDVTFVVIYVPNGTPVITIDEYETALGLGNIQMHVGVCFD